jgi:hypothetical protein
VVSQAMVICDAFSCHTIELDVVQNMEIKLNLAFNFLTIFFDSVASSGNSVHRRFWFVVSNKEIPDIMFCFSDGHIGCIE